MNKIKYILRSIWFRIADPVHVICCHDDWEDEDE
jgi:hypothetical protein